MPYKDPEKRRAAQRRYEKKRKRQPERKQYVKEYQKEYENRPEVKEKRKEYEKKRSQLPERKQRTNEARKSDPKYKKRKLLRDKVREAVIYERCYISTIHKLIGCDVQTARAHLESQFKSWMNWDNYGSGKGKWCIDHIIPVASIDIFDESEAKRIFHYSNMQPLEFVNNSEKGKKIIDLSKQ